MKNVYCLAFLLVFLQASLLLCPLASRGQGLTTSSMTGTVTDDTGAGLPGATVVAIHGPTGTRYGTTSLVDGRFSISNMRVGGPYTVETSFIGFQPQRQENITLRLGEPQVLNVRLSQGGTELQEVRVSGVRDPILNAERTGASTNISREQLENLPTLSRSLQDFTRLTPQANGNSFGGTSNRFNNITIDGAVNNDVFGISSSGTPGGQAGTQPISLDAIQEIQVVLAPYDITFGNFTGGGVNAVTRSGTNEFQGSVYTFIKNENLVGKSPLTDAKFATFTDNQYGFRLGGPILQNKLFFFVNGEMGRRKAPLTNNAGEPGSAISLATAQQIRQHTLDTYGYDVGGFGPIDLERNNDKLFGRLDWNISDKHQLTLRQNYIDATDDNLSRSGSNFSFGNNAYQFKSKQNISVMELRSNFSPAVSNNLILGYSRIREQRQTAGTPFPQIQILNLEGVSANSAFFGSERSSFANELDQDIFEVTNNVRYTRGVHTFTLGTHNEFFKFRNLFINNLVGRWDFNSLADYLDNEPARARITYSLIPGEDQPATEFKAAQLGFYVQDELEVFTGFRLTVGLRADIPVLPDKPLFNQGVSTTFPGVRTDQTPSGQVLWAPRAGFNYDVTGDRSLQLRGGAGIFTGRVPFVWLSNQFVNSGLVLGTIDVRGAAINGGNGFEPDISRQRNVGGPVATTEINAVDKNFRIPQIARFNLAGDLQLAEGLVGTLEGIYTKTLNNIVYRDINLLPATTTINPVYSGGADTRPLYNSGNAGKVSPAYTNVIFLDNSSEGYSYNLTAQLQKTFTFGLNGSFAYTYGRAEDVNSGTSSTALSNWEFNQIVENPNDPPLATAYYETRHRLVGSLNYKVAYGPDDAFSTGISLFYSGFSGTPFTYLYNGDLNGDGRFNNDLLFVPASLEQINLQDIRNNVGVVMRTRDEQWQALDAFIANDPYLSERRGQYAERNGARSPWEHRFDVRLMQDLGKVIGKYRNALQLTFDVSNVGNLISKDWGRNYFISNNAVTLITRTSSNGFNFNRSNPEGWDISDLGSRWQAQFGIRYLFN